MTGTGRTSAVVVALTELGGPFRSRLVAVAVAVTSGSVTCGATVAVIWVELATFRFDSETVSVPAVIES
jgi:hypothetical protein